MTDITKNYECAVLDMCQEFVDMYADEREENKVTKEDFVGCVIGDVICLWDCYLNIQDIKLAIEHKMTWDEFIEWYYNYEGVGGYINLRSWLMGLRPKCTGNTCPIDLSNIKK